MQGLENRIEDLRGSRHRVAVPEAENTEAGRPQKAIAARVVRRPIDMLTSIQFDDDRCLDADEVADVEPDRMLTAEPESAQSTATQMAPETTLGIGRILPEIADMAKHGRT